ncbi:Hypothetical predicted protein [Paramuricea clavata]|uniref:Uncharacterized protein n=1 Tax=Paramuricea clavata TaxID=317549 RepID=A0A7D9IG10_PARCT|nr:Hypothetical predicted protein [Paramuricea clavata]
MVLTRDKRFGKFETNVFLFKVGQPVKSVAMNESFLLGTGSMGTCVHVAIMDDGSEVAVKRMLIQTYNDPDDDEHSSADDENDGFDIDEDDPSGDHKDNDSDDDEHSSTDNDDENYSFNDDMMDL